MVHTILFFPNLFYQVSCEKNRSQSERAAWLADGTAVKLQFEVSIWLFVNLCETNWDQSARSIFYIVVMNCK